MLRTGVFGFLILTWPPENSCDITPLVLGDPQEVEVLLVVVSTDSVGSFPHLCKQLAIHTSPELEVSANMFFSDRALIDAVAKRMKSLHHRLRMLSRA